ncbi:hypothetical protein BDR06DRAFT_972315 [Suillus hirtellus]|nr:hypothetical protein BDR06DRAFT_972315 [Suillus hirtellus]
MPLIRESVRQAPLIISACENLARRIKGRRLCKDSSSKVVQRAELFHQLVLYAGLGVYRLDQETQSRRMGAAGHFPDTSVEGFIEAESAFQESEHDEDDWMDLQWVVYMLYMMCSWSSMRQWQGPALCQAQTAARANGWSTAKRQVKVLGDREDVTEEVELAQARSIGHSIVKRHRRGMGSSVSGIQSSSVPTGHWIIRARRAIITMGLRAHRGVLIVNTIPK